jgi:hypothetical protein
MAYKQDDPNTRKQIPRFSVSEWISFRERFAEICKSDITERDKKILEELIVNMRSTQELAYLARYDDAFSWCKSQMKKPMSASRIRQILCTYYPEFHIQTTHAKTKNPDVQKIRNEANIIKEKTIKTAVCGKCGSKNRLEMHHLFPVCLGGTNDDSNLIWLCHNCHEKQSTYFRNRLRVLKKQGLVRSEDLLTK